MRSLFLIIILSFSKILALLEKSHIAWMSLIVLLCSNLKHWSSNLYSRKKSPERSLIIFPGLMEKKKKRGTFTERQSSIILVILTYIAKGYFVIAIFSLSVLGILSTKFFTEWRLKISLEFGFMRNRAKFG